MAQPTGAAGWRAKMVKPYIVAGRELYWGKNPKFSLAGRPAHTLAHQAPLCAVGIRNQRCVACVAAASCSLRPVRPSHLSGEALPRLFCE